MHAAAEMGAQAREFGDLLSSSLGRECNPSNVGIDSFLTVQTVRACGDREILRYSRTGMSHQSTSSLIGVSNLVNLEG